jgi:glucose/arabinose dehydrogenase
MSRSPNRPAGSIPPIASLAIALVLALALAGPSLMRAQEIPAFDPGSFALGLEEVASGFDQPVQVVDPGDGSGRLFVVEQGGQVEIVADGSALPDPFLDISDRVSRGYEQGLLSLAFHPAFAENGVFFLYNTDEAGDTRVERWQVSGEDPNRADPDSAELIFSVDQPYPNHNGGLLLFGPDGYLYIGLGDGGSGGDPEGHGQNTDTTLGAILRVNVDEAPEGATYGIPEDNPFASGGGAPEIWVWGLRNPWRFSFDRETGDLLIGDVGQGRWEEISRFPADGDGSRNFGWNVMEGPECYRAADCDQSGFAAPVFAYDHGTGGCSVTGGYVYRGRDVPELRGVYLLADYCSGQVWAIWPNGEDEWGSVGPVDTGLAVTSFGEDGAGELYVVDHGGGIYRVASVG